MLSRLIPKKPSYILRFLSLPSKNPNFPNPPINPHFTVFPKPYSSNNKNNNNKDPLSVWKDFGETEEKFDKLFDEESGNLDGMNEGEGGERVRKEVDDEQKWWLEEKGIDNEEEDALFKGIDKETEVKDGESGDFGDHIGVGADNVDEPWNLKEDTGDVFGFKEDDDVSKEEVGELNVVEGPSQEEVQKLEKEEKELIAVLEGLA
jgi:small subunit ribosomal protein S9